MFSPDSKFARFMGVAFDILLTGILWFVCSLPLVTVAASTTAAYYTMAKVVRHGEGYLFKEFFHAIKLNIRQSLIPAFFYLLGIVVLVLDIIYVWNNRGTGNDMMFIILVGVSFIFIAVTIYYPPMLSRFDKSNLDLIRLSAFSAFRFLPITILCMVAAAFIAVGIYLMPWALVVLPGVFLYLITYPMEYVLKKYMAKPEEGSEEADKWYYK